MVHTIQERQIADVALEAMKPERDVGTFREDAFVGRVPARYVERLPERNGSKIRVRCEAIEKIRGQRAIEARLCADVRRVYGACSGASKASAVMMRTPLGNAASSRSNLP